MRVTLLISLAAFIFAFGTRYLTYEHYPSAFDSITYARGVISYNILIGEPAFPGYFLYVMAGKLIWLLYPDPYRVLTFVSIFFGSLTAPIVFLLGKKLFSQTAGIIATLLYITSGTFWFLSIITLPYIMALFFHALTILGLVYAKDGSYRHIYLSIFAFSILLGIRPHEAVNVLSPLIYILSSVPPFYLLTGIIVFILSILPWAIPLFSLSNGITGYLEIAKRYSNDLLTPGLKNSQTYFKNVAVSILSSFLFALPFFLHPLLLITQVHPARILLSYFHSRIVFLSIWIVPIFLFQVIIKSDHASHTLALLLPLTLILAVSIENFVRKLSRLRFFKSFSPSAILSILVVGILSGNTAFFFRGMGNIIPPYLTYSFVYANDLSLSQKFTYIRSNFKPESTLIVADHRSWRIVGYFLPEYLVGIFDDISQVNKEKDKMSLIRNNRITKSTLTNGIYPLPNQIITIVLFEDRFRSWLTTSSSQNIDFPSCCNLTTLTASRGSILSINYHSIRFATN